MAAPTAPAVPEVCQNWGLHDDKHVGVGGYSIR